MGVVGYRKMTAGLSICCSLTPTRHSFAHSEKGNASAWLRPCATCGTWVFQQHNKAYSETQRFIKKEIAPDMCQRQSISWGWIIQPISLYRKRLWPADVWWHYRHRIPWLFVCLRDDWKWFGVQKVLKMECVNQNGSMWRAAKLPAKCSVLSGLWHLPESHSFDWWSS